MKTDACNTHGLRAVLGADAAETADYIKIFYIIINIIYYIITYDIIYNADGLRAVLGAGAVEVP